MIVIQLRYKGKDARKYAQEMMESGNVEEIRKAEGNLQYEYFFPYDKEDEVLLIDAWENQEAIDKHHSSPMMKKIFELREKYDLHMEVKRYTPLEEEEKDKKFIRE